MSETERMTRELEQALDRALTDDERDALRRTFNYSVAELHDAVAALWRPVVEVIDTGLENIKAAFRKLPRGER